jgi:replicative DNA helicase
MSQGDVERLPPHDRGVERAFLGSLLRDNRAAAEAASLLAPEDMYVFGHQEIYRGIIALAVERTGEADYITLGPWLQARNRLEDAGGHDYLVNLWDAAPGGVGNLRQYADVIRGHAVRRALIHMGNELASNAFEPGADPAELLEQAQRGIFELAMRGHADGTVSQATAVKEYLEELDRRCAHGTLASEGQVVETGWRDLDTLMAGLFPGELTVIAARPSVGKTLVGACLARKVAGRGIGVFVSTLEQRYTELIARMISAQGKLPSQRLRKGTLSREDRGRVLDAADALVPLPIWYDEVASQGMLRIAANARRHRVKNRIGLVVVDYLQLIAPENRRDPRQEQVAAVARRLKILARELEVPVVAMAQLNRGVEDRRDRTPRLADLRESGEIEQSADSVVLLHKPEEPDDRRLLDKLECIISKNRNGPTGSVFLSHDRAHFDVCNYGGEIPP